MRSLWALLILLSLCSYFAQRKWASIFDNDVLQALLQLPGWDESKLVKAADSAKPYEMLSLLSSNLDQELETDNDQVALLPRNKRLSYKMDLVDQHANIYDHKLDYYPNQLTYLLLTKNAAAYKLSCLKLRRKLIIYSMCSTCLTLMQFVLPLLFIGGEYVSYGWRFLVSFMSYIWKLLSSNVPILENSIDYELSSSIFPTLTQCEYQHYGMAGEIERVIVTCTVSINEICGKLFVAIWWFVVINIMIEICSMFMVIVCSVNSSTIRWTYGMRYWPGTREEADTIATFRCRRSEMIRRHRELLPTHRPPINAIQNGHEKKRIEAEKTMEASGCEQSKRWYEMGLQDCLLSLFKTITKIICCCTDRRRQSLEEEAGKDINIYYLLYLIYLRLGKSKSRVEEVIRMTATVLNTYLDDLQHENDNNKVKSHLLTQFDSSQANAMSSEQQSGTSAIMDSKN